MGVEIKNEKTMKKMLIFLSCLILGPILGCLLSGFWYSGANTFWEPIDYFPYPVNQIIAMKAFGREFWVETTENEIYQITYPCSAQQVCWAKSNEVPTELSEGEIYVDFIFSNNKCENHNFVYPLPYAIKTCNTTVVHAESPWITSLALTDSNKLWIWNKPWESPYTKQSNIVSAMVFGVIIGLITSIFLTQKLP